MKSVILSLKRNGKVSRFSYLELKYILKRYATETFFMIMFFMGIVFGSIYVNFANNSLIKALDFLFLTNFEARVSQSFFNTFCACFASNFIFLLMVFFSGMAVWGVFSLPLIVALRGFGTGLTAGYLFSIYSLKGALFYIFVILPGTFIFCMALVSFSSSAFYTSKRFFAEIIFNKIYQAKLHSFFKEFWAKCFASILTAFLSSILDTALWVLFANEFKF